MKALNASLNGLMLSLTSQETGMTSKVYSKAIQAFRCLATLRIAHAPTARLELVSHKNNEPD
jgi:hypothetical protein